MKNIAVIKESCFFREGIVGLIKNNLPNMTVSVYGPSEQMEIYKQENMADLIIIDINTKINYFDIIDFYQVNHRKVIAWISHFDKRELLALFQRGLDGYFYKGMESFEFMSAISSVLYGKCYVHPEFSRILLDSYINKVSPSAKRPIGKLTEREWEVLKLMSQGFSNERIAQALTISEKTVKNHVSSILKKLNAVDRINAVLIAFKKNWLTI